jgi:hypothetical protein
MEITREPNLHLPGLAGGWWRGQVHCPFCWQLIETTLIGLSTLLGPSLLQCRKCGRLLVSHRQEWSDRSGAAKAWFVAVSLIYVAGCAGLAFVCTWCACVIVRAPVVWLPAAAATAWGTGVASLQIWRVASSHRRTGGGERRAHRPGFWSLDFFLPQKVSAGIALSAAALAWLATIALKSP